MSKNTDPKGKKDDKKPQKRVVPIEDKSKGKGKSKGGAPVETLHATSQSTQAKGAVEATAKGKVEGKSKGKAAVAEDPKQRALAQSLLTYFQECNSAIAEFKLFMSGFARKKMREVEHMTTRAEERELEDLEKGLDDL